MNTERPTVILAANEAITDERLHELLLGLEEEGVPVTVTRHGELNPLVLAADAAASSRLGVGIGVALDHVVITTDKLPQQRPYIATYLGRGPHHDRVAGSNAARLVKRLPLRQERSQ